MPGTDEIYAVDASSLITMNQLFAEARKERAWDIVTQLCDQGRIRSSEYIFPEIERNDADVYRRVRPLRSAILVPIDSALLLEAGRLARLYPIMARVNREGNAADPWVIAIARLSDYKVICEEGPAKPQRMPTVCTREGVRCGNIHDMLAANGMSPR